MLNTNAYPVIVTSPTAGGKNVCVQQLVSRFEPYEAPPTITNRPPRRHLDEACDSGYVHVPKRLFNALMYADALVESNVTKLYSYGTPRAVQINGKCIMLFALDADAAARFKDSCPCTIVALIPAGKEILKYRLDARSDASPELLADRLEEALYDIKQIAKISDFTVVSDMDNLEQTIQELEQIVRTCALKTNVRRGELQKIIRSFEI